MLIQGISYEFQGTQEVFLNDQAGVHMNGINNCPSLSGWGQATYQQQFRPSFLINSSIFLAISIFKFFWFQYISVNCDLVTL